MTKVVVTDYTFASLDIEEAILRPLGCDVIARQCKTAEQLLDCVADADCIITQFAPIGGRVIGCLQKARAIVRYGIGVDNVDLAAAQARAIPVCNVPDYCIDEVADHTLAFILALTRNVVANSEEVRTGHWQLAVPLDRMRTLSELSVGIIGFGRIGREVARRLQAFKCRVLVHDRYVEAAEIIRLGFVSTSLEDLLSQSDIVTLHCPATGETRGLIDRKTLSRMKPGVMLVNLARGSLVDSEALVEALDREHVSAAALDVYSIEPIPGGNPILTRKNVVLSAHVASTSARAVRRLRETAASIAAKAIRGESLPNVVNGVRTP